MTKIWICLILIQGIIFQANAQIREYNKAAGKSKIYDEKIDSKTGKKIQVEVEEDQHGNPQGNQYDLAADGAFTGNTIAVIQLYTGENFDFNLPRKALEEKGFSVYRWTNNPPSPQDLKEALKKCTQLWIISTNTQMLNEEHIAIIKDFFNAGHGVYIWGDNEPYYADANYVARELLGVEMTGNLPGDKVVGIKEKNTKSGLLANHLITTGLVHLFEGITIATISSSTSITPLVYGSAGNLVVAVYDKNGKRAVIDGGFTRLYCSWDEAGTGRYVKNAAAWLVNLERFNSEKPAGNN